jgi:hypothetical protein
VVPTHSAVRTLYAQIVLLVPHPRALQAVLLKTFTLLQPLHASSREGGAGCVVCKSRIPAVHGSLLCQADGLDGLQQIR